MITKYFIKNIITNKSLWAWGVFFSVFWLFMGAFVFGFELSSKSVSLYTAAIWYAIIALISTSTISTTVAFSVYYASSSLSYVFRFTELKPYKYVMNFIFAAIITGLIMGTFIMVFTSLFFGLKSGYRLIPVFPLEALSIYLLSSIFMFLLALILIIIINNYFSLKNISFVSFIPMILTFIFAFTQLSISLPKYLIYLSPFTEISNLLFYLFYGHDSVMVFNNPFSGTINPHLLIIFLSAWIIVLLICGIILIRKIKPVNIEEGRQI